MLSLPVSNSDSGSMAAGSDLVRSYLRDIGRVPLLSHEQEITLGRQVQELMAIEEIELELTMRAGGNKPSEAEWAAAAGLSPAASRLLWLPLPMLLVLISAVVGVLVTVWLERKISAAAQQRIGPEYAGALGILQPMADGLKLLFKEDVIPARADGLLFSLGPVLVVVPVILSWLVVPFGQHLLISNVGVGIFLWISLSSIQPIGLLMSGYASNNK